MGQSSPLGRVAAGALTAASRQGRAASYRSLWLSARRGRSSSGVPSLDVPGWQIERPGGISAPLRAWRRGGWDLLLVDLVGEERTEWRLRRACEDLARGAAGLWAVLGHADEPSEEIWARQLGAWLYVPGYDDPRELDWIFQQAELALGKIYRMPAPKSSLPF